jgi:hypothetical protein
MKPTEQTMTCTTCKHSKPLETPKLANAGFVNCKHMKEWRWLPGHSACQLSPVRWESK